MSKRLLQRGRYPKGSGINIFSNPSTQYPQTTSAQHPVTSQVPFYNPVQSQPSQSVWNPSYPNPGTYQTPAPPAPDPNAFWSSGQMHAPTQQSNDPWNWPTEHNSENSSYPSYQQQTNNQLEQQNYQDKTPQNYQDKTPQNYPEQSQQNYPEQNQQNYPEQSQQNYPEQSQQNYPEQAQPNYLQQQSNCQQYPNYQQQQPIYQVQPVIPPATTWQQIPPSQLENQNFVSQHAIQDSSSQQNYEQSMAAPIQGINNNSNAALDASLQSWENGSLNITEPKELPWTYSAPQYYNPTQNLSTDFPPNSVSSDIPWNYNSISKSESEISDQSPPPVSLTNDNVMNGASNNVEQQRCIPDVYESNVASNCIVPGVKNESHSKDLLVDYSNSSLSAFFQNSDQNSANSERGGTSTPEGENVIDSLKENLSRLAVKESEMRSVPTEDQQDDQNLEDTDNAENQEVNFIQEEVNHVYENMSVSPARFSEEPVNQEVIEPNKEESTNSAQKVQLTQDYHEVSPEEPLNQQIPVESGVKSRSTSSERERVVIRPREESPFKPPKMNSNSKGIIVQQETDVQNVMESDQAEEKTVVQEVNLETFPDNLERPPDYEELRKQSSFYASHQKHLRTELNSSPSSLLCDNPDIPCIALAPAAPPIHSSAKSDKSESSSDSKREMSSYNTPLILRNVVNEPHLAPPAGVDSELLTDPSATMSRSNSSSERISARSSSSKILHTPVPSEKDASRDAPNDPPTYLKESKIKESRNATWKAAENLQNPSYSSANSDYSSSSRSRPDPKYPTEADYNRQRFADRKYPSFDERQYYSDRERSRPSSRASLDDRSEDYRYPHPKGGDYYPPSDDRRRGHPDSARPPSRMSESDVSRPDRHGQYGDYYKQQYPYSGHNQDYYQRPANYRGYEYDSYQRDPYYASYYDAYRYAYSNFNYGFYDEMYRNDPRYRQYREDQYRQYYAKYGYDGDYDRSSAHSGRSSANEPQDMSSTHYLEPDIDSNASEISAYNMQQDYSSYDAPNEVSVSGAENSSTPSTRLTPVKFSYAHPIVRFSAGGLLITAVPTAANPTLAAPVKIQNMQMIMENEESFQELKNYQGPLIRGLTHKNDVIEFCNQKIKFLRKKDDVVDRDSYILLWELMILLLRQNGSVAGSDIAELLLNDHEVLRPHATPLKHSIETPQGEHSPAEVNDSSSQSHAGDTSSPDEGIVVLHDKTVLNSAPKTVDVDKVTRKFREFLLFGHKKDALEWAMKHDLWGHALFLASKMDLRTYANVMTRFANSLALNDPLQTLYQLMSGRQPSSVTCVADKKWGDWRPHLAMILSNPSTLPDVDSRSITTLGDTLASRGCLPAAQFCYIMAQVEFGSFEQKSSKLVLLNADHRLSFEEFATNEAIQCSEIYEYAQSLANPSYLLIHLQMYKFLYALRLVEHGLLEEALHYCEVIAGNLQTHTILFSYDLISEVFKLASRLKYYDPHFLQNKGEFEDQDDPEWLKNLHILVQNYNNIVQGRDSEIISEQQPEPVQTVNDLLTPATENMGYQNIPGPGIQTEASNSMNNQQNNWNNTYQQTNWNQQNMTLPNSSHLSNNQQEINSYYSSNMKNQSNFQMESSIPSHEENETTDVPSSPITQTPPFDYYSGSNQQEWSSIHSLPSVPRFDVGYSKSDLEHLVMHEETESDVALCSSAHSTPLRYNYLLSNNDSDDRQMLMTRNGALSSCLKSRHSLAPAGKGKKCIKFDASVASGHQGMGIRRRKFSKKKRSDLTSQSDSSPEGSPSKEKKSKRLSLLATLGILREGSTKRKRKAKKKSETIEKLLQSKKTFAIDEPCDVERDVDGPKRIASILKKMSGEEKKDNSELGQLMASEFNKKPPLIFGGTYPIDEPFESKKTHYLPKNTKILNPKGLLDSSPKPVPDVNKKSKQGIYAEKHGMSNLRADNCLENFDRAQFSEDMFVKMSPIRMFKKLQASGLSSKLTKENVQNSIKSNFNVLKPDKNVISDPKQASYDQAISSYTNSSTVHRERRDSALSSGSRYSAGNFSVSRKPSGKESTKTEAKTEPKPSSQAGKTWLGGIFSRLLPKAPNQMILPDDKNPTIVWDEVEKRWMNKDSNDDDETNAPLAPPTDMELMGSKSSDKPTVPLGNSMPPVATSQVNKFQRPKTRGMRQNYVDILNNSGATTKSNVPPEALFPTSYEQGATSSSSMFVPPTASNVGDDSTELENTNLSFSSPGIDSQELSRTYTSAPLMFDPAEFESRRSNQVDTSNQRHTIGRTGRRAYPR